MWGDFWFAKSFNHITRSFYYKRKLVTYYLTVYDRKKIRLLFYVERIWGQRGASKIATCLIKFMKLNKKNGITEFIFTPIILVDKIVTCSYLVCGNMLHILLQVKITHRFLERGHTQNEGDNMHACRYRELQKEKINLLSLYNG